MKHALQLEPAISTATERYAAYSVGTMGLANGKSTAKLLRDAKTPKTSAVTQAASGRICRKVSVRNFIY